MVRLSGKVRGAVSAVPLRVLLGSNCGLPPSNGRDDARTVFTAVTSLRQNIGIGFEKQDRIHERARTRVLHASS